MRLKKILGISTVGMGIALGAYVVGGTIYDKGYNRGYESGKAAGIKEILEEMTKSEESKIKEGERQQREKLREWLERKMPEPKKFTSFNYLHNGGDSLII